MLALLMMVAPGPAFAAERTRIELGKPLPRFDKLQPGTRTYLRYRISKDGVPAAADVQTKEIRFEQQAGQRRVRILQRWEGASQSLRLDSLFEDKSLRPLTHQRDLYKDEKVRREGFRFLADKVVGIADQPENTRKDFEVAAPVPTFNFETDMETLQALPLRKGAEFEIVFYHPGAGNPAPYVFKVAGEEKLQLGGVPIHCWVVTTDYNAPERGISRFWLAKKSQVVVRTHSALPDGSSVVKVLLPTAAP
jgi:hypothetical protein